MVIFSDKPTSLAALNRYWLIKRRSDSFSKFVSMKLQSSSNVVNITVPCIKSSNSSSVRIVVKHSSQVNGSGVVVPLPTITVL